MSKIDVPRHALLFNAIVDVSLRTLIVLAALSPRPRDIQELVNFDYLLVHSGDVPGGPDSLHPALPHRTSELFVRRGIIRRALEVLEARRLAHRHLSMDGISFTSSELTDPFLKHLHSPYAARAQVVAIWLRARFGSMSRSELETFMNENAGRWGAEMNIAFPDDQETVSPS